MKQHLSAIVFSVAIVLAALILGNAYWKRSKAESKITVTGLGETGFLSDLSP